MSQYDVVRESVIRVGADWKDNPPKLTNVVSVTQRHNNWSEVILPTDPRFDEAIKGQ